MSIIHTPLICAAALLVAVGTATAQQAARQAPLAVR